MKVVALFVRVAQAMGLSESQSLKVRKTEFMEGANEWCTTTSGPCRLPSRVLQSMPSACFTLPLDNRRCGRSQWWQDRIGGCLWCEIQWSDAAACTTNWRWRLGQCAKVAYKSGRPTPQSAEGSQLDQVSSLRPPWVGTWLLRAVAGGVRAPAAPKAAIDCGEANQANVRAGWNGPGASRNASRVLRSFCITLPPPKKKKHRPGGHPVGPSPGENKTKFLPAAVCEGIESGGMRIVRLRILWRAGKNFGLHWHTGRAGPINGSREAGRPGDLPYKIQILSPAPRVSVGCRVAASEVVSSDCMGGQAEKRNQLKESSEDSNFPEGLRLERVRRKRAVLCEL